ncbi:type VI secretion system Vgr family protein [Burkholderia gladioli]|uniref:type VI secretion system Vgr family protein n=1 Tax=Burkholderia gladioli TaxID=28095 RepID=UPI003F793476
MDSYGRHRNVTLVAERLVAHEGLGIDFHVDLTLLANEAGIKLDDMLGKLLVVTLVRPDGGARYFSGYCTEFSLMDSDAALAKYRAVLRPWSEFLKTRVNNRLFLGQTLQQQIGTLLADYSALAPAWEWRVKGEDPSRTMNVQGGGLGESDWNYLVRHLEAAGYMYWWEHGEKGMRLVIGDDSTVQCGAVDGDSSTIRFQSHGGPREEDAISTWSGIRRLSAGSYSATAFDFKSPRAANAQVPTLHAPGGAPAVEHHEYVGHYGFTKETRSGDAVARLRMEEIEVGALRFDACSNHHGILPGRWFQLGDHFSTTSGQTRDHQYLILEAHHEAANNYLQADARKPEYRNRFVSIHRNTPWRPGRGLNSQPIRILAPQTATIAGTKDAGSVDVDEYGRVRVIFHWDRASQSSARIRVASGWAGGEKGMVAHPRVGSEVILMFLDGNPDRPIVTATTYNGSRMPPWTLPDQHVLTGLRSRELSGEAGNLAGGRSNHVLLDDTPQQLQLKLRSDTDASELTLGHNVRIDDTQGRTDQRARGFELRTDAHGAVRAAKGLLITSEARPEARAHATDMGETLARLDKAHDLHETLSGSAHDIKAQETGDQDAVLNELKTQNEALRGGTGGSNPQQGEFPEFAQPHLTLASPAGIEASTTGSTHFASDRHIALSSGAHTSIAAGQSMLVSAHDAVRVAAFEKGIRMVAAAADIDIEALKNSINVLAKLDVKVDAERITLTAKEEVLINGGSSYTRWNDSGITHGTKGAFTAHAASHGFIGPDSLPVPAQAIPGTACAPCMVNAASMASPFAAKA